MKKALLILFTILMVTVAACSTPAGSNVGGDGGQTNELPEKDEINTSPPKEETDGTDNGKEEKTIVFSTFFPDEFFKEAKQKYEAKHPNITIDLRYVETDDAQLEVNLEQFVKTTGTAMLSGKGPDLIEMDQLPSGDYIKKKLLANLGDRIDKDPDFKKEDYFSNILDGIEENGGIYGMPIGFFIYGLVGNETLIGNSGVKFDDSRWDWRQFAEVAKELAKKADSNQVALGRSLPEYMITQMVNGQYAAFVDQESGKANFDSAAFIDLLKEVKFLFDQNIMSEGGGLPIPIFIETQINSPSDYVRELRQSEYYLDNLAYKSKLYLKPNAAGQPTGGFFRTYKTIGLNAKSDVKEEAWDFVKFMLSDEMQARAGSAGFPLNKASYAKVVEEVLEKGEVESIQPIGPLKDKVFEITQQDIDDLEKFLAGAKYPVQFKPSKVDEIIREESKAYFSGQKPPEAVAKLIQNRVSTVLNE